MATERTLAKDFLALMKNIKSFSDGQAAVTKWDDKNIGNFEVTISPNDGYYKEGEFVFEISMESCDDLPRLNCKTAIYHPNIDTIQDPDGEICINLFDVDMWNENCSMQDVVQGLLFLMYNPNLDDPLCGEVSCSSMEEFGRNVEKSIAGGRVGDYLFPVNPRYARLHPTAEEKEVVEKRDDEEGEVKGSGEDEQADGENDRLMDGERTGLIEEMKDGDGGAKSRADGAKDDVESKQEEDCLLEERYFGIKEYITESQYEDGYEEEEEDNCDEEESDSDSSILSDDLNVDDDGDVVHDEDLFELFDKVDDSLVDENRKNLDGSESVVSWSKMVYGAENKPHVEKVQVLIEDLSFSSNSNTSEGACKETGNAAGSALNGVPQGLQRPTVTSRFYRALQTRAFRRWLV